MVDDITEEMWATAIRENLRDTPALILITGPPGVGKFTVGKQIHEYLNANVPVAELKNRGGNSVFFHNNLVLDLALAAAPCDDVERHVYLRRQLLQSSLHAMLLDPGPPKTIIATSQLVLDPSRKRIDELKDFCQFAGERGLNIWWFDLECLDVDEHAARVTHETRAHEKLKDAEHLKRELRDPEKRQIEPNDVEHLDEFGHVRYHALDTSHKRAEHVAMDILDIMYPENH